MMITTPPLSNPFAPVNTNSAVKAPESKMKSNPAPSDKPTPSAEKTANKLDNTKKVDQPNKASTSGGAELTGLPLPPDPALPSTPFSAFLAGHLKKLAPESGVVVKPPKEKDIPVSEVTGVMPPPMSALDAILLQLPPEMRPLAPSGTQDAIPAAKEGLQASVKPELAQDKAKLVASIDVASPVTTSGKTEGAAAIKTFEASLVQSVQFGVDPVKPALTEVLGLDRLSVTPPSLPQGGVTVAPAPVSLPLGGKLPDAGQAILTPVGHRGWADDFSQKVSWISTQKDQIAELHLNPPDLGPLHVVLKISDSQATALFSSPHSAVRDAVENAMPRLREILADNGITLGNTTVGDQSAKERERFASPAQNRQNDVSSSLLPIQSPLLMTPRRHNGMVDTFA